VELAELPAVIPDAPNLLDPKEAASLVHSVVQWSRDHGDIDVVVIDTLSATTPGGNENSGEDIGMVIAHCKLLHRETGALVVLVHHSGKDATRGARGWSGLRAAADAEIEVTRNGDHRTASITKMKDGTDGEAYGFKLRVIDLGVNSEGEAESSCVVEYVDAQSEGPAKKVKLGPHETIIYGLLRAMAPSGTCAEEDLVEGYKNQVPKPDGRDQRRKDGKRALTNLIAKKMAFKHGEDRVSLTSLVTTGEGEWLK
jgi:hypothetical protein